ncbi:DNA-binding SARP family transcriptional activator [Motilibacter peucedani]|uniref:DNA-binding SARP family transcriptional activator n=1 Tax=Motilibacter peucedani TaxID=598650 RepID=A0A420XMC6_9ACTN|nr:BTAD domain-containing putative transcriptional regulator [Motilibacter peucedani]RKS71491.1 DNA-binding SARP family transcriptional activator [Motilibacter peucedani]
MTTTGAESGAAPAHGTSLCLLGEFHMEHEGKPVQVSVAGQRLIALLAVHGRPVRRASVSAVLWPDSDGTRATANLRSVLHRLPSGGGKPLVSACRESLELADDVSVDLHACTSLVLALCEDESSYALPEPVDDGDAVSGGLVRTLLRDLLPDWSDEWLLVERERHRQMRMHALELLATRLRAAGRYTAALHAALSAVAVEPLRESAHRVVAQVHIDEGNVGEALRQYDMCRRLLDEGLGIRPSASFQQLVFPRVH